MSSQCEMGLEEADDEDVSKSIQECYPVLSGISDHKELVTHSSQLLLVTVEYTEDGSESDKLERCFNKGSNLLSNVSVLDAQQLGLLQPPNSVPYSILQYNPSFENDPGTNISEIEDDKVSMCEGQLLLLKGHIDEQNKNTIVTFSKVNSPNPFVPNDVIIAPLPEAVVNADLTNDIISESAAVMSANEMIEEAELTNIKCPSPSVIENPKKDLLNGPLHEILIVPNQVDNLRSVNNAQELKQGSDCYLDNDLNVPQAICEEDWESDSSCEDEVCQVIADKPVMCRAVASLPANFLSIEKVNDIEVGVFARKDIPKRTQFGPVEGVLSDVTDHPTTPSDSSQLQLLIKHESGKMQMIDVSNEHLSNWMRYVRPAKTAKEQNLVVTQYGKSLYYTTTRFILAKEELRVWYSISYASTRGLPLLLSLVSQKTSVEPSGKPCNHCNLRLKHSPDCIKFSKDQKHSKKIKFSKDIIPKYNLRKHQDNKQIESLNKLGSSHRDRKWRCSHCQRCFTTATLLNLHTLTHAADNLESCEALSNKNETKCSQCIQDEDKDKVEQENKPLNCSICSKRFYTNADLVCHIKSHTDGKKFECPICNKVFDKVIGFKAHVHSHSTNGYFSCSQCSKKYVEYKLIRKHIRTFHCGKNHKCVNCSKKFPTLDKLRIHELSHSDHRQFLCANCGKQFKRKDKLSDHMRKIHYPEKDTIPAPSIQKRTKNFEPKVLGNISGYTQFVYKCHICIVGFKRRGMLVNHLANRHPDISPDSVPELNLPILKVTKDYYCQYCEKIYKSSSKRKAHILKNHPGAQLPLSNKQMSSVKDVTGQENGTYSLTVGSVTTNPQGCQWCHKQYASKAKLLQHQRTKHSHLLPKSLQKPKRSSSVNLGEKFLMNEEFDKTTDESNILQDSINSDVAELEIKGGEGHCFTDGEFIIDAPTLKRALREEMENVDGRGGAEELLSDSGIQLWDEEALTPSLTMTDGSPFLAPYNGR